MPTVLRLGPYRFFFYSNEGFEPPHVHMERDDGNAKFWLTTVALASSQGIAAQELRRLERIVAEHRERFIEAWNDHFDPRP